MPYAGADWVVDKPVFLTLAIVIRLVLRAQPNYIIKDYISLLVAKNTYKNCTHHLADVS